MNRVALLTGFVLALIFNMLLPTKIDYHGPDSNVIRNINFVSQTNEDDCYKMEPYLVDCP